MQLEGLSSCGSILSLSSSALGGNEWHGELRIFDGSSKLDGFPTLGATELPCGSASNICFNEGRTIACAGDDGKVYFYGISDRFDLSSQGHVGPHDDIVHSVHANSTGFELVSGSWDKTVCLWDVESLRCTQTLQLNDQVMGVRFLTDSLIATLEREGSVSVWDARGSYELTARCKMNGSACSLVNMGRNHLIIGCEDGSVVEWTPNPEFFQVIRKHNAAVHALAVCPDTERLLSGSDDGFVFGIGKIHHDFVRGAAWIGGRPVTSSWDGTMKYVDNL